MRGGEGEEEAEELGEGGFAGTIFGSDHGSVLGQEPGKPRLEAWGCPWSSTKAGEQSEVRYELK